MYHLTHENETRHTTILIWHKWIRHVAHMNKSCRTCKRIIPHIWMSHVTHTLQRYTNGSVMSQTWISHAARVKCMMSTPHMRMSHVTHTFQRYANGCVMSNIRMSHVTHANASWHICGSVTWLVTCFVTQMNATCRTYEWVMLHMWMCHITCKIELFLTREWVMPPGKYSNGTQMDASWRTCGWVTLHK